ncbi:MAG: DsrE family protein [Nitrospirae bacterium]|nr:DsrE family protein [Nitrospirota bacterium]
MKIVFLIRSNPCESARPAEAIRIAAGLGTGNNSIKVILSGNAVRALSPDEDDLEDIDIIEKFLPIIKDWEIPLYVDKGSAADVDLKGSPYSYTTVNNEELSELIAGGHSTFVF